MRIAVIDVGSNTVRLVVSDAEGQVPLPVHTGKLGLRLADRTGPDGFLDEGCIELIADAVRRSREEALRWGAGEPLAFATAVVRDAPNRGAVLAAVRERTGVRLEVLPGHVEAELTFLAARRWMGWRAGPMALLDIGGGSTEIAFGRGGMPDFAVSLPLGAARITRDHLHGTDPVPPEAVHAARREVRHRMRDVAARVRWEGPRTLAVTSRTFQQLARLCGAPPGRLGPFVPRTLHRNDLGEAVKQLRRTPAEQRSRLPGISGARAGQSLGGALVAHTAMKLMGIETATVCPWAIREGILLRVIEEGNRVWWTDLAETTRLAELPPQPVAMASSATAPAAPPVPPPPPLTAV